MQGLLVKIKDNSIFPEYSGWGGVIANSRFTQAHGWSHEVVIAAPPLFDGTPTAIWLPEAIMKIYSPTK